MIELRGCYYRNAEAEAVVVLVQHDGALLYVWHLADPFYLLLSTAQFRFDPNGNAGDYEIALPGGALIRTENGEAVEQLKRHQEQRRAGKKCRDGRHRRHWFFGLFGKREA